IAAWHQEPDPRSVITIAHLMRMSSGLDFTMGNPANGLMFTNEDDHSRVYFGAINVFEYSISQPLAFPPNTVWRYRNCDPLTLGKIIRDTLEKQGENYLTFPQRALFDKIGAHHFVLEPDPWGNFIMTGFDYGTARDWARFGLLHLWDGVWQEERILPEGWVNFVRTPAPADASQGYGGLFWLNRGRQFKTLPEDMFWPAGHHGQAVFIIPSRDVVVVRLGLSVVGDTDPYFEHLLGAILSAVDKNREK
ncbi:MAG: serine hydrolase, partial [Candidatus Hydrogenedentes bacterium]|nr:serine hydrolase [Candidatus Hydrogenedentota bacterium]